jgi:DNA-3-methyladenine glycosylase I
VSTYCDIAPGHPFHGPYHEFEYGFPVEEDDVLFERLILEINQAGLSWLTVLRKREGYKHAYDGFRIANVAAYGEADFARLLADEGIIRNRLKIRAATHNARVVQGLQQSHGTFKAWLDKNHPMPLEQWLKLFRATFTFTGPEVVREFLLSTGYLPGAHGESCPVLAEILKLNPPWMRETR